MILRIKHTSNFTTLANTMLNDRTISFKARGLLAHMLSLPDNWKFYRKELASHSDRDGESAVSSALKELIEAGYITYFQKKKGTGEWAEVEWEVREIPNELPQRGFPRTEKPRTEKPPLLSTNRLNTNRLSTNKAFDAEDLPVRLGSNKDISTAWRNYVQSRSAKSKKITPLAYKMLVKKMLAHSPTEIVAALERSVMNGWTGVFFNESAASRPTPREEGPAAEMSPWAQKLYVFTNECLHDGSMTEGFAEQLVAAMKAWHKDLPRSKRNPEVGPNTRLSDDAMFSRWLTFLKEKQQSGFVLQSPQQLRIGQARWNEFVRDCERYTMYSFRSGEYLG